MVYTRNFVSKALYWDPDKEVFTHNDTEANSQIARPQRAPYGTDAVLAKAGIKI